MSFIDAFVMPNQVTIMARTSSITNSFVNGIIPCIAPTEDEVAAALSLLGMDEDTVACAYCGDPMTEWDHLNPLVKNKRPTGYVSEIHNLVPSCSKCNQSKGNKPWRMWIISGAKKSPRTKGVPDLDERIRRLEEYERTFEPVRLDFESIVDPELWNVHWRNLEHVHNVMQQCQAHSDLVKQAIADSAVRAAIKMKHSVDIPDSRPTEKRAPSLEPQVRPHRVSELSLEEKSSVDVQLPPELKGVTTVNNKYFAPRCLAYLSAHSANLEDDLRILCNKDECKIAFNHDQALLKRLDETVSREKAREDANGYPRYYKTTITLLGKRYLVSKEWYGLGKVDRDNRTPFLEWMLSRLQEDCQP